MANHVNQDLTLLVQRPDPLAHVLQDVTFALRDPQPPAHVLQDCVFVIRENTPDDSQPPRTSRASFVG